MRSVSCDNCCWLFNCRNCDNVILSILSSPAGAIAFYLFLFFVVVYYYFFLVFFFVNFHAILMRLGISLKEYPRRHNEQVETVILMRISALDHLLSRHRIIVLLSSILPFFSRYGCCGRYLRRRCRCRRRHRSMSSLLVRNLNYDTDCRRS